MYHSIIVVGNLGRDPEMRTTPSGQNVTSFSVATNRKFTGADGQPKDETLWFRVSVWGKQAEACQQFLTKGQKVLVEGQLVGDETGGPRVWTTQDGKPRASFEVKATAVRFLSPRATSEAGVPASPASSTAPRPQTEEDLPF